MSEITKITLSDKELSIVTDASWILTKQLITGKVYELLASCVPVISLVFKGGLAIPMEAGQAVPKISKGENYRNLPYVILDHPRYFNGKDIFAVRTMFWWAHFFSVTLQLSGEPLHLVRSTLVKNKKLLEEDFYIAVSTDQWQHHFEADNYLPVKGMHDDQCSRLLHGNEFIKLSLKYDLHQWENMPELLAKGYEKIAAILR